MSTLFYDHRPPIKYPKFNLDRILLFLFNLGLPTSVINQKLVKSTMEKIKPFRSNPKVLSFFWECQLELKNGLLLYECFQNIKKYPTALDIFKVWIIAIINVFDRQKINICYIPENMIQPFKIHQMLNDCFNTDQDLLFSMLTVILTVFMSSNPMKASKQYSLNFKTLRMFYLQFQKICTFCFPFLREPWQKMLEPYTLRTQKFWFSLELDFFYNINVKKSVLNSLRHWICLSPFSPLPQLSYSQHFCPQYLIHELRHPAIIPLSVNPSGKISLWTHPPYDYRLYQNEILQGFRSYKALQKDKKFQKLLFHQVIQQIENDVSLWPGKRDMLETKEHFYQLVVISNSGN